MFRSIKNFIQRGRRGYSDSDMYDIDSYLCEIIPPMLRSLKKGYGCPSEFYDNDNINNECQKWYNTLEEMAQGFEAAEFLKHAKYLKFMPDEKGRGNILYTDVEATENARQKMEKGLFLFCKYFLNLWD